VLPGYDPYNQRGWNSVLQGCHHTTHNIAATTIITTSPLSHCQLYYPHHDDHHCHQPFTNITNIICIIITITAVTTSTIILLCEILYGEIMHERIYTG
jgi:hypothetical protein